MNLKNLFTKRSPQPAAPQQIRERAPDAGALDMDALDACVGGREDAHGVGCYVHSTQPRGH